MSYVDFEVFDADNHYYEAQDAMTRHLDKNMRGRCSQWAEVNGRHRLIVGGSICEFIPNPSWDPIAKPGSLENFFRGKEPPNFTDLDPLEMHRDFQDRDARLATMDEQGIRSAVFYPTQAVGVQSHFLYDIEAMHHQFHAFNQWLLEDWGFGSDGRIYGAPLIPFSDPEKAVAEIEWALEMGAKIVCTLPGPVPLGNGKSQAPSMPDYDPIWDILNATKTPLAYHGGDSMSEQFAQNYWEPRRRSHIFDQSVFRWYYDNSMMTATTFAAMLCHGLFERYPNLKLLSIENSSSWVKPMLDGVSVAAKKAQGLSEDPVELFKRHVWISPNFEDNIQQLKADIGVDQILFGSDWPHAEGLDEPTKYFEDIKDFTTSSEVKKIMHDNMHALIGQ